MKFQGNHYSTFPHNTTGGSGVGKQGTGFGRVTISGKTGDVVRMPCTGLITNVCQYQAILAQAFGAAVHIAATLVDPDVACNPNQDTDVWGPEDNISPSDIHKLTPPTASALRITFIGDATVVIAFT